MKLAKLTYIAATTVLVALAMTQPSEARIVYTRAHVVIGGNYDLDLNHDGVTDFSIKNGQTGRGFRLYAITAAGNGVMRDGSLDQAAALIRGEQIGPSQMFVAPDVLMRGCRLGVGCFGAWNNVTNRYLGLKFIIHGKLHYGWAPLNVHEKNPFSCTATLTGYAYETTAGKSIKAGQTKSAADEWDEEGVSTGASVSHPITDTRQPASLGMLALGAQGVPLWRRKESLACISENN